jgi:hypothetical protein
MGRITPQRLEKRRRRDQSRNASRPSEKNAVQVFDPPEPAEAKRGIRPGAKHGLGQGDPERNLLSGGGGHRILGPAAVRTKKSAPVRREKPCAQNNSV